ncbi:unnamed protein product [Coffea canephora]|uniref:NB-ARC domain-containing protein n=1 Tax=Coffea canephora TaxID=49390 RepID=A0A068UT84_COFCA|nr:unnamed protein product [Coffea canephora]
MHSYSKKLSLVYEDPSVKRRLQSHAWLTVSQTFHMDLILKNLIRQLYNEYQEQVPRYVEALDGDQLRAFVKDLLRKRTYIIVLDDIWRLDSWEAIKYAFPDASCRSRIMLTTRIADTAFRSCTQSHAWFKMMPLDSVLQMLDISKLSRENGNSICSIANLRSLYLNAINDDEILDLQHPISRSTLVLQGLQLRGRLEKVSQWLPSLQRLTTICLFGSGLRKDPLEHFQDVLNLEKMILLEAYEGEELFFKAGGFGKFKKLELRRLQKLKRVRVEKNAMPCLQELMIVECKQVDELPWGIQYLNKLQSLHLYIPGDQLIMKLQDKGSEEYRKIVQIPTTTDLGNWSSLSMKSASNYWRRANFHVFSSLKSIVLLQCNCINISTCHRFSFCSSLLVFVFTCGEIICGINITILSFSISSAHLPLIMREVMAENSVAFLLKELSTFLLQQNTNLGSGLEKDVQFIKDELGSMRAFLRDAEAKEDDVYELQEWLRQVREVASDTEDVLDEFEMKFGCHHVDGLLGRIKKILCSVKNVRARYEISSRLKNIRSRVEDISARHQRYQSTYSTFRRGSSSSDATEDGTSYVRGNALLVEEAKLVGINEPKRELISRVLADDSHLKSMKILL